MVPFDPARSSAMEASFKVSLASSDFESIDSLADLIVVRTVRDLCRLISCRLSDCLRALFADMPFNANNSF